MVLGVVGQPQTDSKWRPLQHDGAGKQALQCRCACIRVALSDMMVLQRRQYLQPVVQREAEADEARANEDDVLAGVPELGVLLQAADCFIRQTWAALRMAEMHRCRSSCQCCPKAGLFLCKIGCHWSANRECAMPHLYGLVIACCCPDAGRAMPGMLRTACKA